MDRNNAIVRLEKSTHVALPGSHTMLWTPENPSAHRLCAPTEEISKRHLPVGNFIVPWHKWFRVKLQLQLWYPTGKPVDNADEFAGVP